MRINKRVYPRLETIHESMPDTRPMYVSRPFANAALDNHKKFNEELTVRGLITNQWARELTGERFILLLDGGGIFYGEFGYELYFIQGDNALVEIKIRVEGDEVYLDHRIDPGLRRATYQAYKMPDNGSAYYAWVKSILLFKKYAEIKEKELPPNGKVKEFNCRYKSDFDFKIGLLTESWYTESCQTHPFLVRSHWRWQPCGEKSMERKLIWIDTFMKQGYRKGPYMADESKNP